MDPNLFHMDWDRVGEVLITVVVLAFILERALALLFEHRLFVERFDQRGLKEPLAYLLALFVCVRWQFDAISTIVLAERTTFLGEAVTAAIIAGGSKASVKLFREIMGIRSRASAQAVAAPGELPKPPRD